MEVSELFPHVGECADDICFIRSMLHRHPEPRAVDADDEHRPHPGRPAVDRLVAHLRARHRQQEPARLRRALSRTCRRRSGRRCGTARSCRRCTRARSSPTRSRSKTEIVGKDFDPKKLVSYIHNEKFTLTEQRRELDLLETLDRMQLRARAVRDPQLEAAISRWKSPTGCRPRRRKSSTSARRARRRSKLYGPGSTARGCLMAVRLVERGVRMVQVYYAKGDPWDAHGDIQAHRKNAKDSDQPFAAVIKDLKSRGLFKDTLVVCGSEFGRTPVVEVGGGAGSAERPRSQSVRLHDVAGRRRRQGRHRSTAPPTISASRRSRSRCTCTTCTPRSCTCWASITPS